MATTMQLIAKQTVGSGGAASVTFSNIPQTFTDLKVIASMRNDVTGSGYVDVGIQFNGTTSGYSYKTLYGNGSSAGSFGGSSQDKIYDIWTNTNQNTTSTFTNAEIYIPNYTSSNQKSVSMDGVSENNATGAYATMSAGLSGITSAITSISIVPSSGNFTEYSTFYLYGISNSSTQNTSVPLASGGNVITTDGSYWYHAFKTSGTFTPLKNLTADVLVVAGGGGGGAYVGGGGGAGGVSYQAGRALTSATNYICTVGAGGTAGAIVAGGNGGSSTFDTIVSNGGGGGSYNDTAAIYSGGSGGGTTYRGGGLSGGAATQGNTGGATGYGFRGGNLISGAAPYAATGGGGAGGAGQDVSSDSGGGNGGAAKNTWSTWLSATGLGVSGYIAGGGGGGGDAFIGYGGGGGAGNGGLNSSSATAAVANTGSGGGGTRGYNIYYGGAGGSGLIIVRYAV